MDTTAVYSSAQRLIEAFEKIGTDRGVDRAGVGPSPPPAGLVRMFEDMLAHGAELHSPGMAAAPAGVQPEAPGSPVTGESGLPPVEGPGGAETVNPEPALSIPDFFSLQFHVAMARFCMETGSQIQQKTAQGLESLLKNKS